MPDDREEEAIEDNEDEENEMGEEEEEANLLNQNRELIPRMTSCNII